VDRVIPILQIVGYKNSGKTTVIKKLVQCLSAEGYQVGVIKHHGHGGQPNRIEPSDTDTSQFHKEGAFVTAVEGDGSLIMNVQSEYATSLETIISIYLQLPVDLILVEGYKDALYPKVVMVRSEKDWEQLSNLCENIVASINQSERNDTGDSILPSFQMDEAEAYTAYIIERFLKRR
jgi:molybdopterin-guanine dinucleotide biosynthesis protein B